MKTSLKIGLIDFDPTRGHATLFCNLIRDRIATHGCELVGYYGIHEAESRQWCLKENVPFIESPKMMMGLVDAIIIPAASDPERHEELFTAAAELGVPVYIDKPFAQNAEVGLKLFRLADAKNVPLASSSALRFSTEVAALKASVPSPLLVESWGGYSEKFDEFIIHPVELAVALAGADAKSVTRKCIAPNFDRFEIDYGSGRVASVYFHSCEQAFEIAAADHSGWKKMKLETAFFIGTIEAVLGFFRSKRPPVLPVETLLVLKVIDICRELKDGEIKPIEWSSEEIEWRNNYEK